ncbi:hypothetical protein B0T14DRAFT_284405 [Immersiella caudata]|uniref:Uncharacterized protein n=1 Tax=Immersiella caudata TaxID=314043 RepID=A0AA39WE84_9PEZI|nr:hypothetical protein B0T14DRAFT_284405 [Immersiella caudata]
MFWSVVLWDICGGGESKVEGGWAGYIVWVERSAVPYDAMRRWSHALAGAVMAEDGPRCAAAASLAAVKQQAALSITGCLRSQLPDLVPFLARLRLSQSRRHNDSGTPSLRAESCSSRQHDVHSGLALLAISQVLLVSVCLPQVGFALPQLPMGHRTRRILLPAPPERNPVATCTFPFTQPREELPLAKTEGKNGGRKMFSTGRKVLRAPSVIGCWRTLRSQLP